MTDRVRSFAKVELTPKRYYGYAVLLFIFGTLFPPLAVAARFGIGTDFFINLVLTICGYIPGHVHNFYIQNIRNNKNNRRTPKWIQKYGLVNTSEIKRKERRSQWAGRYAERTAHSALRDQPYEEGQAPGSRTSLNSDDTTPRGARANGAGEYWNRGDEQYYNADQASVRTAGSAGRWRYPANFEDTVPERPKKSGSKKRKDKKDRWARTEDAYSIAEDQGGSSKRKKSKRKNQSALGEQDNDSFSRNSTVENEFPEDPEGGLYRDRTPVPERAGGRGATNEDDIFSHEL